MEDKEEDKEEEKSKRQGHISQNHTLYKWLGGHMYVRPCAQWPKVRKHIRLAVYVHT